MSGNQTDLIFFTNDANQTLLETLWAESVDVSQEFDRLSNAAYAICHSLDTLDEVEVVRTVREALRR